RDDRAAGYRRDDFDPTQQLALREPCEHADVKERRAKAAARQGDPDLLWNHGQPRKARRTAVGMPTAAESASPIIATEQTSRIRPPRSELCVGRVGEDQVPIHGQGPALALELVEPLLEPAHVGFLVAVKLAPLVSRERFLIRAQPTHDLRTLQAVRCDVLARVVDYRLAGRVVWRVLR